MTEANRNSAQATVVMTSGAIRAAIEDMARHIVEANPDVAALALLGILRRGRPLADRLAAAVEKASGAMPLIGSLATTLYRDDLRAGQSLGNVRSGETHFDFDVNGRTVVLVDDVLNTGRTVRAALDEVMDYGRPARIQLACLIDRGLRELPIQPDYLGRLIATSAEDHVAVRLEETDGEDVVILNAPSAVNND